MKLSNYYRIDLRIEKTKPTHNFPMKNSMNWEMGTKIAKLLIVTVAVYLGMKYIFPIVLPFLIALLFARLLYPLAKRLERKLRFGKAMARAVAYVIFLLAIGGIAAGLLYLCYRMGSNCFDNLDYFLRCMDQMFHICCSRLERISGFSTDEIQRTISEEAAELTGGAVKYSKDAGWFAMGLLAKLFVTFVATLLMLNDYERIIGALKKTAAGRHMITMLRNIKYASGAYVRAQLCIMALVTAVCVAGLLVLKIPHAAWIGLAIGFCDALPFLGTGTVFVPWALIAGLLGKYQITVGCLCIYLICSFIRQILEPRLVGRHLGVPPLAVLMSIYIGLRVYGGSGVILGPVSALMIYEVYQIL